MTAHDTFDVRKSEFNSNLFNEFQNLHYAKDLWPIVYVLSDGAIKEAYVGETTDTYARLENHLRNNEKNKLTTVHLITSPKFNKSATLDVEANLIKYISGDGQFKLLNRNDGLANHNYYQKKEVYWDIFKSIWDRLRKEGIAKNSIDYIDNSDLFKYSPYKSLTTEQKQGLLTIIKNLLRDDFSTTIVEGGAGTGKTILAIFLFKLIHSNNEDVNLQELGSEESEYVKLIAELKSKYPNPKMALVVPMSSFRKTLKKVFKNIKGLNENMVVGPSGVTKDKFDIIIVDESHRLRRRTNLVNYRDFDDASQRLNLDKTTCSELDWVIMQCGKAVLFYDANQSVKPSDVKKEDFDGLKSHKTTVVEVLKSQFRVKGGNDYVQYIDQLLNCTLPKNTKAFNTRAYDFLIFDSLTEMVREIKQREEEDHLARLIAGFSWEWISKGKKDKFDIKIGDVELKWNNTSDDWINSPNAVNEVGCIHTTQGYDLNYAGIIFGNEITYNKSTNEIVIREENYHDINGKRSIKDPSELKDFIVNIYKTIMLRGIKGTYVYACDSDLREYLSQHIPHFENEEKEVVILAQPPIRAFENSVPLFNLKAAAGYFSELQIVDDNVNEFEWVAIPERIKSPKDFFACKVIGDSMNKVIPNGSICLFQKYSGGSRNGKIVLVEHTNLQDPDFGSCYTVKEYHSKKNIGGDQWSHESITLKPLSDRGGYENIEITEDESSNLKVIGIFEMVL